MTEKLRWGILSTAHISEALLDPLRRSKKNILLAVASRDPQRAQTYARKHKVPRAHPSYASLLADPQVDVIYNPLPNSLHAEWTIKALKAGKHVLCEKPLALSVDEVDAMTEASREHDRLVVEALMYRSHPLTLKAREVVRSGKLGRLRLVRGTFSYPTVNPGNYRLEPEMGGGSLWDVGIYPLGYARFLLETEPVEVFGAQTLGATGVDESFAAQCRFPGDITLQFDCSMATPYHTFMEVIGEQATLVIPQPFTPGVKASLFLT